MGSGLSKGKKDLGAAAPAPVTIGPTNQGISTCKSGGSGNVNNEMLNESVNGGDDSDQDSVYHSAMEEDDNGEGDQNRICLGNKMDPNRPRKVQAIQRSEGEVNLPTEETPARPRLMLKWLPSWYSRFKKMGRCAIPGESTGEPLLYSQPMQQQQPILGSSVEDDSGSLHQGSDDVIINGSIADDEEDDPMEVAGIEGERESTPTSVRSSSSSSEDEEEIDSDDLSFKKTLIARIEKRKNGLTSMKRDADDPRRLLDYDRANDTFNIGGIIVTFDRKALICSACDSRFVGRASKPTWNAQMHSLEKAVGTHVNCKHLDSFKCTVCSKSLSSYYNYTEHMDRHLKDFVCTVCGKKATSRLALKRHQLSHMAVTEKTKMGKKVESHEKERTIECPKCPKKFADASGLNQHLRMIHDNRKKVKCPKCDKFVLEQNYRRYHSVFVCPDAEHANIERVQCTLCVDTFKTESSMRNHFRKIHAPDRKNELVTNGEYACSICSKVFSTRRALAQHKYGSHQNEKNRKNREEKQKKREKKLKRREEKQKIHKEMQMTRELKRKMSEDDRKKREERQKKREVSQK